MTNSTNDPQRPSPYIICDIDGVLAIRGPRGPWEFERCEVDVLCLGIYERLRALRTSGIRIALLTGRNRRWKTVTTQWLEQCEVPYEGLFMRAEDDDARESWVVKRDIFSTSIQPEFGDRPIFIIDDDPSACAAFNNLGLLALHVCHAGATTFNLPRPFNRNRSQAMFSRRLRRR